MVYRCHSLLNISLYTGGEKELTEDENVSLDLYMARYEDVIGKLLFLIQNFMNMIRRTLFLKKLFSRITVFEFFGRLQNKKTSKGEPYKMSNINVV